MGIDRGREWIPKEEVKSKCQRRDNSTGQASHKDCKEERTRGSAVGRTNQAEPRMRATNNQEPNHVTKPTRQGHEA